jgi:hypothetical protein
MSILSCTKPLVFNNEVIINARVGGNQAAIPVTSHSLMYRYKSELPDAVIPIGSGDGCFEDKKQPSPTALRQRICSRLLP